MAESCEVLQKELLLHLMFYYYYQDQMAITIFGRVIQLVIVLIVIQLSMSQCTNAGAVTLPTQYQSYLTAQPVNQTQ